MRRYAQTLRMLSAGPDPMHPRDNECSSVEDGHISDDDEIEELYADPDPPTRTRVWDVERVEVIVDQTPPARTRVQDDKCAASNLCGTNIAPSTRGGHMCLNYQRECMGVCVGIFGLNKGMLAGLDWRTWVNRNVQIHR